MTADLYPNEDLLMTADLYPNEVSGIEDGIPFKIPQGFNIFKLALRKICTYDGGHVPERSEWY